MPATRSLTVCETSTSLGLADAATRAADRNGQAGDLSVVKLALAGVDASAHLETEITYAVDECLCTTNGPRWAVEGSEEAVARSVALLATEASQLSADDSMVTLE